MKAPPAKASGTAPSEKTRMDWAGSPSVKLAALLSRAARCRSSARTIGREESVHFYSTLERAPSVPDFRLPRAPFSIRSLSPCVLSHRNNVPSTSSTARLAEIHHPRAKSTTKRPRERKAPARRGLLSLLRLWSYRASTAGVDWHRPCITSVWADFANMTRRTDTYLLTTFSITRRPLGEGSKP